MKIRDIVNHEVTKLETCESEPIHIPGSIQPFGVLIALDSSLTIRYCSANCMDVFHLAPKDLLNKPVSDLWPQLWESLQNSLNDPQQTLQPFSLSLHEKTWDLLVHQSKDLIILELEEHLDMEFSNGQLFRQTTQFVEHIEQSESLQQLCQHVADATRTITGYDRVMIYRFDKEYNGEVYAESRVQSVEPFLDLHYPHTDIPAQARELYLRNLVRMIADVHYNPVPILTANDGSHKDLDLSDAQLRSVSLIHIQYLKNMGVGATLTISLILEGRLWGLIACHHYGPMHLNITQRKAALLQGHFLTSQIRVQQVAEEHRVHLHVEAHLQQLLNVIPNAGDFKLKFESLSSILAVANASGVILLHQGNMYEKGKVPPREKVRALIDFLADHVSGLQFSTSCLSQHYPQAESMSRFASGILYFSLGNPKKDCIIWFREEMECTINWAGNPHDAVKKDPATNQLKPRSSFALWKERVRFHSKEWVGAEINAASRFAGTLQNQFHLEYLKQEEAHQRMLKERLQKANEELESINWITTHDLREPIRKIQIFASRAVSEDTEGLSQTILTSIERIQSSARRMQNLVDDIMSYSLTTDKSATFVLTDLNNILQDVISDQEEEISRLHATFLIEQLPKVHAVPFQMHQLFSNLVENALKFARKDTPLQVEITCSKATINANENHNHKKSCYLIRVKDNGIGFQKEKNQRIFNIFYRLHDRQSYTGTGVGLAICKRIIENHGGTITADGEPDQGAIFNIYLPDNDQ